MLLGSASRGTAENSCTGPTVYTSAAYYADWIEQALTGCITDDNQLRLLTEPGLCHGWAGLVHTVRHAANDAHTEPLALAASGIRSDEPRLHFLQKKDIGDGFLTGSAGFTLVDHAAAHMTAAWDTCLLLG